MPLGMKVGLGPGDIVLDGDPDPPFREDLKFGGVNISQPHGFTDRHEIMHGDA